MGFSLDTEDAGLLRTGATKDAKAVAEAIFAQHSDDGDTLKPGAPFLKCCQSLARDFSTLSALSNDALVGRAFQLWDVNADGLLQRDEFVSGVHELLNPTTPAAATLVARLQAGAVPTPDAARGFAHVKRVAVVGAGVAGLQLAEQLVKRGLQVVIFEKSGNVGGVWRENYADFGLQVPKELYEFPSFPYPEGKKWDAFPKGAAVQEYIEAFADAADLRRHVRFHTSVLALAPLHGGKEGGDGGPGWAVTHAPAADAAARTTEPFDFVAVATGMYGWPPHIPNHPGREGFGGEVIHSFEFKDRRQAAGKRVVVVGGGKSAVDCAVAAVKGGAAEATLLCREAHWPVPRKLLNLIPFQYATYSRLGHSLLPTHHDVGPLAWWLHCVLAPLKWAVWRLVELLLRLQFALPKEMVPTARIEVDVFSGGQILTYEARDLARAGKLRFVKGAIDRFEQGGVQLRGGACPKAQLPAELVMYATGFVKSYEYLDQLLQAKLDVQRDGLYLYRSMLPPGLPNLAFVGCEVSTFNNVLTHGLQALWLARLLSGEMAPPPRAAMRAAIEAEQAWKRAWMPATSARAAIQQLHMPAYHDALLRDMGEPVCRKSNPLAEALMPYTARDYRTLFGLPDRTAWARAKAGLAVGALALPPLLLGGAAPLAGWLAAAAGVGVVALLPYEPPAAFAAAATAEGGTVPREAKRPKPAAAALL